MLYTGDTMRLAMFFRASLLAGVALGSVGCVTPFRAREIETRVMTLESKLEQLKDQQSQTQKKHEAMFEHFSKELKRFNDEVLGSLDNIRRGSADDSVNILGLQELVQSLRGELSEVKFKLNQVKSSATPSAEVTLPTDKNALYLYAEEKLRDKNYREAILAFQRFVDDFPGDIRVDNSLYGIAEAYFQQSRYQEVPKVAEQLLRDYGDGGEGAKMLMLLHESYLAMDSCERAQDTLTFLLKRYPKSNQVRDAKQKQKALERSCKR